jgi:hypothetical protein
MLQMCCMNCMVGIDKQLYCSMDLPPVHNLQFSKDPVMLLSIVESLDKKVKHSPLTLQLFR